MQRETGGCNKGTLGFSACGKKISKTTVDYSKTIYNGQQTNGGITAVYKDYLYFINGTKTNDGTKLTKNTRSAICRVKIKDDGSFVKDSYEVVVDNLVGYNYGSIYIFGDFLYYTTPNNAVNYADTVLSNQTKFMRYDLVNKKSYTIYTTKQNSSDEKIAFAYYVDGQSLNLVVYETTNATITSIKIDEKPTTNYVIEDVLSCVLSENYGQCVTSGASKDANNFVFYTKTYTDADAAKNNKVYRVSPTKNDSKKIFDENKNVSLLSIKKGMLFFSIENDFTSESIVYAQAITGGNDTLSEENANIITYTTYTNIIFYEGEGNITAVCYDEDDSQLVILTVSETNKYEITKVVVDSLTKSSDFAFIGLHTLKEQTNKDDEEADPVYDEVTYLFFVDSSTIYKIEVMRNGLPSQYTTKVKLSTSTVSAPTNLLVPEIIGNYIYMFAKDVDEDNKDTEFIYLFRADITIEDNSTDKAEFVGIKDEADNEEKDDENK